MITALSEPAVIEFPHANYHWQVHDGTIQLEGESLAEGSIVTVLTQEGDETFELGPEQEAQLLAAIGEADRGEVISASQLLQQIRSS